MRSARLLSLLLLLQERGRITAPEAAQRLEASVRTIYRDVEALSAAGVPVWTEQGRDGGIVLMPGYRTDLTGLTAAEAQALIALTGKAVPDDLGLGGALVSALPKLLAAVPPGHRGAAEQASRRLIVDHEGWFRRSEPVPALEVVQTAVFDRHRLRFSYRHARYDRSGRATGPRNYLVDPLGLVLKGGRWYLVAAHRGVHRVWRVDRIDQARDTGDPARGEADLGEVWERLRVEFERIPEAIQVQVRVRPQAMTMLIRLATARGVRPPEASPPPTQSPDERREPEWVRVDVWFRAPEAAMATLIGFGADLEVLAPASVRRLMIERARAVLDVHGALPAAGPLG
ncbi:MAG: helix-turn-helix transcriptional regulator [Actinomycetales bacterium]